MNLVELASGETLRRIEQGYLRSSDRVSSGVHISNIIRDIENTVTKRGKRKHVSDLTDDERARMGNYTFMGWGWEEIIRPALRQVYHAGDGDMTSPGTMTLHGLSGTPDAVNLSEFAVEEFKATWRSSRRDITTDFWSWFVQMKAYCRMLGTNTANLRVFFVNGDYRDSGPQIKMWQAQFSDEELESNWEMLLQHAKDRGWLNNRSSKRRDT